MRFRGWQNKTTKFFTLPYCSHTARISSVQRTIRARACAGIGLCVWAVVTERAPSQNQRLAEEFRLAFCVSKLSCLMCAFWGGEA